MTSLRELAAQIDAISEALCRMRPTGAPHWQAVGVKAQLAKVANLDAANVLMAAIRLSQDRTAATPAQIAITSSECWREKLSDWTPPVNRETCCQHGTTLNALGQCSSCAADQLEPDKPPRPRTRGMPREHVHAIATEIRDAIAKHRPATSTEVAEVIPKENQ